MASVTNGHSQIQILKQWNGDSLTVRVRCDAVVNSVSLTLTVRISTHYNPSSSFEELGTGSDHHLRCLLPDYKFIHLLASFHSFIMIKRLSR